MNIVYKVMVRLNGGLVWFWFIPWITAQKSCAMVIEVCWRSNGTDLINETTVVIQILGTWEARRHYIVYRNKSYLCRPEVSGNSRNKWKTNHYLIGSKPWLWAMYFDAGSTISAWFCKYFIFKKLFSFLIINGEFFMFLYFFGRGARPEK